MREAGKNDGRGVDVRFHSSRPGYSLFLCTSCFKEFSKVEEVFTTSQRLLEKSSSAELARYIVDKEGLNEA